MKYVFVYKTIWIESVSSKTWTKLNIFSRIFWNFAMSIQMYLIHVAYTKKKLTICMMKIKKIDNKKIIVYFYSTTLQIFRWKFFPP